MGIRNSVGIAPYTEVRVEKMIQDINKNKQIFNFIKEQRMTTPESMSVTKAELSATLKNHVMVERLDIKLFDKEGVIVTLFDGVYEVSFLLNENQKKYENLYMVYLSNDAVEILETTLLGNWLTFKTTHFSEFYLIGNQTNNIIGSALLHWIIVILSIIIILEIIAITMKRMNNKMQLKSIVLPVLFLGISDGTSMMVIWILVAVILILLAYLIYLFMSAQRITVIDQTKTIHIHYGEAQSSERSTVPIEQPHHHEIKKEEPILEEDNDEETVELDETGLKIRYNYSFEARMHQAPLESQARFSELKNYLLSYEGVEVRKSWKYERFMYKGKPILKAWIHGNNLKLYYNIEPKTLRDSKYSIEDVSYAKMHENTPSLFIVNGPRLLDYAKELVAMYLKDVKQTSVPTIDYTVKYMKRDRLVEMKLVRVNKHK